MIELVNMAEEKSSDDIAAVHVAGWNCKTRCLSLWSYGNNPHCFFHVSLKETDRTEFKKKKKKDPSNTAISFNQANRLLCSALKNTDHFFRQT